jgi:hypothetical protein
MKVNQIIQLFFGIMMLVFAYLQLNDPDPFLWVLIYVLVAAMLVLSAFGKRNSYAFWGLVIIILIPMGLLSPGLFQWLMYEPAEDLLYGMSPDRMYIEESREFLGLFIALLFLIPVYIQLRNDAARTQA